jgi:hypothetical protein
MRSYRYRLMIETGAANPAARSLKQDTAFMLRALQAEAESAAGRTGDEVTRYHLEDTVVRIDAILEGEDPR